MSELNLADSQALTKRGVTINSQTEKGWFQVLRFNKYDDSRSYMRCQAFTALLLSYCDNLQSLSLDHHFYHGTCTIHAGNSYDNCDMGIGLPHLGIISLPIVFLERLKNLKTIEVYNYQGGAESYLIPRQLIYLFTLPQVESLALSVRHGEGVADSGPRFPPRSSASSVTALHLRDSELRPRAIGMFLDQTPRLKSLRLGLRRFAYAFDSDEFNFLNCPKLGAHIAGSRIDHNAQPPRSKVLEHLSISVQFWSTTAQNISTGGGAFECGRDGDMDWKARLGIKGSLGSLRHFTALKALEISLPMLLGWQVYRARPLVELLPDSLTELCFRADMSNWELFKWDVDSVAALVETYLLGPSRRGLRVFKYMLSEDSIRSNWDRLEELRHTCQNNGISCQVIQAGDPIDPGTEPVEDHGLVFSKDL